MPAGGFYGIVFIEGLAHFGVRDILLNKTNRSHNCIQNLMPDHFALYFI